jgi:biotin carboxylase
MATRILMVALNRSFLAALEQSPRDYEVYVLEERELYEAEPGAYRSPVVRGIRFGDYQQSDAFMPAAHAWHDELGFDVVVPGLEYAVRGAYAFAGRVGLVTPGASAVSCFTNKHNLRLACRRIGVPQPRFAKVQSVDDVVSFFGGGPIVLKPTNRRASVGVVRIDAIDDAAAAWAESTAADEGKKVASRNLAWEYMAEDFVGGYEVSVETLVADHQPCFHNVTYKETVGGRYFAETGHTVPAPLPDDDRAALVAAKERMLRGLGVSAGLFHSEWKVTPDGPHLIECAARAPGDLIPELIGEAYGFNLYDAFVDVLTGRVPQVPRVASKTAAVRYFTPPPGRFVRIDGLDLLDSLPQLMRRRVNLEPGQAIRPIKDSWTRVGYYALRCDSLAELHDLLGRIEREVRFVVA